MQIILEQLKNGDADIVAKYQGCDKLWGDLIPDIRELPVKDIAEELRHVRAQFARIAGGNSPGKVMMVWSCFSHLYSCADGFGDNHHLAEKMAKALTTFPGSTEETKHEVKTAASVYRIDLSREG